MVPPDHISEGTICIRTAGPKCSGEDQFSMKELVSRTNFFSDQNFRDSPIFSILAACATHYFLTNLVLQTVVQGSRLDKLSQNRSEYSIYNLYYMLIC